MLKLIIVPIFHSSSSHHCHRPLTPEESALMREDMGNLFLILNIIWAISLILFWIKYNNRTKNNHSYRGSYFNQHWFDGEWMINRGIGGNILDIIMCVLWTFVIIGFLVCKMR